MSEKTDDPDIKKLKNLKTEGQYLASVLPYDGTEKR
jgi:type III secretory pathway component EscU